jgi:hypothetical protein
VKLLHDGKVAIRGRKSSKDVIASESLASQGLSFERH